MTVKPDPERFRLPDEKHQAIFERRIVPALFADAKPSREPLAVLFGGQPGAGKSAVIAAAADELQRRGGAVVINGDEFRAHHPRFAQLLRSDDRTAAFYTDRDSGRWVEKSIDHARQRGYNVIVEGTMRNPDTVAQTLSDFRAAGYETDARALAVNSRLSELGILLRYESQRAVRGHGRATTEAAHAAGYEGVPRTLARIEDGRLADRVQVVRRSGEVVYQNELRGGDWQKPPRAAETLQGVRDGSLSKDELQQLVAGYARVSNLMRDRKAPDLERAPVEQRLQQAIAEQRQQRDRGFSR